MSERYDADFLRNQGFRYAADYIEALEAKLEKEKRRLDKLDSLQTQTLIDAFWSMWHDEGLDSREAIDRLEEQS